MSSKAPMAEGTFSSPILTTAWLRTIDSPSYKASSKNGNAAGDPISPSDRAADVLSNASTAS
jgi:hypothetical protein